MPSKRVVSKCESCGNKKSVSNCSGHLVCGNCAPLYGAINRRPDVVLKAIRHLRPNLLADIGEQLVPVAIESEALELIADAVGYEGTSGNELVERIRECAELAAAPKECAPKGGNTEFFLRLRQVLQKPVCDIHELVDDVEALILANAELDAELRSRPVELEAVAGLEVVLKALDCMPDDWQLAAIQTAALLDAASRQHVIDAGLINQQRNELGAIAQAYDRVASNLDVYKGTIERLAQEKSVLANQLSEMEQVATNLETTATVNEQIFARLRELIDGNGLSNAELPSALEAVLGNAADSGRWLATIQGNGQQAASPIDSHLLDLVLDFPGIPLERIALIREAV